MEDFKKGQEVTVFLDKEHSLGPGESADHKAKFVAYHLNDRQWADVDLETEHAGGTKRLSVPVFALKAVLLLFAVLCSALPSRAQFIGYTSPQSVTSTPFNNVLCTGSAQNVTVPNLGQAAHYGIFLPGAPAPQTFVASIQGSNDGISFVDLSDQGTSINLTQGGNTTPAVSLSGTGYYNIVRITVTCNPNTARFTVQYSGVSLTPGQPAGSAGYSQVMKNVGTASPSNTNLQTTFRTPFGNSAGTLEFTFVAANGPASSTLLVTCASNSSFISNRAFGPFTLTTSANAVQTIESPPAACPFVNMLYTSGGASAGSFNWDYAFYSQSAAPLTTPNVYKTVAATAAGNTNLWVPSTGTKRFVVQGVCVEVTGNASLAVAGVETIDLQDNTTSTGLTFSVFVNSAAGTGAALFSECVPHMQNGLASSLAGNTLNVNLSTALATGVVRVRAYGFEE